MAGRSLRDLGLLPCIMGQVDGDILAFAAVTMNASEQNPVTEPSEPPASTTAEAEPAAAPTAGATGGSPPKGRLEQWRHWLWQSDELREAQRSLAQRPAASQSALERAQLAAEGAERLLAPIEALRHGDGAPLALLLQRESLLAAAEALEPEADLSPAQARRALARLPGADASALDELLLDDPQALRRLPPDRVRPLAERARWQIAAALDQLTAPERQAERSLRRRWWRLGATLTSALLVVSLLSLAVWKLSQPADLAAGRGWSTSSTYGGFNPATHMCDGVRTQIQFHTAQDTSPWYEVDLGGGTKVGAVELRNRTDSLSDRAVPLVIELSDDRKTWREVARQDAVFSTIQLKFTPQQARYVRVRALKRTFLHLEAVKVRAHG